MFQSINFLMFVPQIKKAQQKLTEWYHVDRSDTTMVIEYLSVN